MPGPSDEHDAPALREAEEHFAHLVAAVQDYAIFLLTPEGYVRTWNAGTVAD